jgi:hypothetical protein
MIEITQWSEVQLEKLTVVLLVENFPAFYETLMLITVFTKARHWTLS